MGTIDYVHVKYYKGHVINQEKSISSVLVVVFYDVVGFFWILGKVYTLSRDLYQTFIKSNHDEL